MAKFTADRGLQLQDDSGVWARFTLQERGAQLVDGVTEDVYAFETDDAAVAARLRKVAGVTEVGAVKARAKADG